jgi:hypothetical protein
LPTTIAEAMLDRFQLIDKRERIRPVNMEIHRVRALLILFATAIVAAVLVALVNAVPGRATKDTYGALVALPPLPRLLRELLSR